VKHLIQKYSYTTRG